MCVFTSILFPNCVTILSAELSIETLSGATQRGNYVLKRTLTLEDIYLICLILT